MLEPARSALVLIDLQPRLMAAIDGGEAVVANAVRLARAAARLAVPALHTEQNPRGLGPTVAELAPSADRVLAKMEFDATANPEAAARLEELAGRTLILAGCEAHVCVLQTALGLLAQGCPVAVVADAVGSRTPANHRAGLDRAARHGAEIVTTEMVLFEWLGTAANPAFREVQALLK